MLKDTNKKNIHFIMNIEFTITKNARVKVLKIIRFESACKNIIPQRRVTIQALIAI